MRFAMRHLLLAASVAASAAPLPAWAQAEDVSGQREERAPRTSGVEIQPYIEAAQVLTAQLSPGDDVVTYTRLAAGVDAGFTGRYSAGSVSVRYERQIGWGDANDADIMSGIARTSLSVVPRHLTVEAGALASQARVESGGATTVGGFTNDTSSTSRVYSVYAGPTVQTNVDDLAITGSYRIGYTRVEAPDAIVLAPGEPAVDIFDESVAQAAEVRAGFAPNTVLPVGVGVGAGWNRQDISNLDQRLDDRHVRADVTVPVSRTVALVGGIGYEEVEVSSRDALRDTNGDPVIGPDGRYVTDTSAPRQIAYEADGLIWDVGVMWRPSNRTALQAYVGRRYASTTYYGSFSYSPNPRTSLNVAVYDSINGFGGSVMNSLANLPTEFTAIRNPITGELSSCVIALDDGTCALGNFGSLRSAIYRSRGITASIARSSGRTSYGLAAGYDRRSYIAAAGTALAAANGIADENYWLGAYASQQLDQDSGVTANAYVNWFDSGFDSSGNGTGYSASLSYYRQLIAGLIGTAAVGIDGVSRDQLPDYTNASALVGLRYTF